MFGLPEKTYFSKPILKNKFYDKLTIDKKLERSFIDQISLVRWLHKLSADTLNVEKGSIVEEVQVFLIKLKTGELDPDVLRQMDRQINYHLIFILEFKEKYQIWTAYKEKGKKSAFKVAKYYHTEWMTEESFSLQIDGLNMDTIYENLVRQIMRKCGVLRSESGAVPLKEKKNARHWRS